MLNCKKIIRRGCFIEYSFLATKSRPYPLIAIRCLLRAEFVFKMSGFGKIIDKDSVLFYFSRKMAASTVVITAEPVLKNIHFDIMAFLVMIQGNTVPRRAACNFCFVFMICDCYFLFMTAAAQFQLNIALTVKQKNKIPFSY